MVMIQSETENRREEVHLRRKPSECLEISMRLQLTEELKEIIKHKVSVDMNLSELKDI